MWGEITDVAFANCIPVWPELPVCDCLTLTNITIYIFIFIIISIIIVLTKVFVEFYCI